MGWNTTLQDVQFRLEYVVLRAVVGIVRAFPLEMATAISARVWRFVAPIVSRKRHLRALENLTIAFPEKTQEERLRICLAHWANLGRVMVETMQVDRILGESERLQIVSGKTFDRYRNKMGPIVGISLHLGNWDLAIWPLTLANANPAAVYRSVNNPYVDEFLRDQRSELYPGGLFGRGKVAGDHGDDRKTARVITDYVRNGGRLGMVCDLFDRSGIEVDFFGKPAKTQAIGAMIARRVGARIWLSRCKRVGTQSRFEIELKELRVPRGDNQSEDVRWIMSEMQKQFEVWIRETPEQWMWSNRRWR